MSKRCALYTLSSSEDGRVRYIGQTTGTLKRRLAAHLCYARKIRRSAVQRWIVSVLERGHQIEISLLAENVEWHEAEIAAIADFRARGFSLLNLTDGGEGTTGFRPKGRKRPDLAARNKANAGKPGRPRMPGETEKLMQYVRGAKRPWVAERNRSKAGQPGHKHTEEHKEYMRQLMTGKRYSSDRRRNISLGKKAAAAAKRAATEAANAVYA